MSRDPVPHSAGITGEIARFILVRGACTVLSYGLYLLLLRWTRYEVAYIVAFVFGIVLAYVVNAIFVFREPMRRRSALQFPFVYLLQFAMTMAILRIAVEHLGVSETIALAIAIVISLPVTFLLSRWVLKAR